MIPFQEDITKRLGNPFQWSSFRSRAKGTSPGRGRVEIRFFFLLSTTSGKHYMGTLSWNPSFGKVPQLAFAPGGT